MAKSKSVLCPVCRAETKLVGVTAEEGVAALPTNFVAADVIAEKRTRALKKAQTVQCNVCDETAKWSCDVCHVHLCDFCCIAHHRAKAMSSHGLSNILDPKVKGPPSAAEFNSGGARVGGAAGGRVSASEKCPKHPTQDLELFCHTHGSLVCG